MRGKLGLSKPRNSGFGRGGSLLPFWNFAVDVWGIAGFPVGRGLQFLSLA